MNPQMIDEFAQRLCESRGRSWDHPYCKKNHWRALIAHPTPAMTEQMLEWVREEILVACLSARYSVDRILGGVYASGIYGKVLRDRVSFDMHRDLRASPKYIEPTMIGYDLGSRDGDTAVFARYDTRGVLHIIDEIRETTGISEAMLRRAGGFNVGMTGMESVMRANEAYNQTVKGCLDRVDQWRAQYTRELLLPPWRRALLRYARRIRSWFRNL